MSRLELRRRLKNQNPFQKKLEKEKQKKSLEEFYRMGLSDFDKRKYESAYRYFKKAAFENHSQSQYLFALLFEYGLGTFQSNQEAIKWYTRALLANPNFKVAKERLEQLQVKTFEENKNPDNANHLFTLKNNGVKETKNNLEEICQFGLSAYDQRNYEKAYQLFKIAAFEKYSKAQHNFAVLFEFGLGTCQSDREAIRYYKQALLSNPLCNLSQKRLDQLISKLKEENSIETEILCDLDFIQCNKTENNPDHLFRQGFNYFENGIYKKAYQFFKRAAVTNHVKAQYNLGVLHEFGRGTAQSNQEAIKWYTKALLHNPFYKLAQNRLQKMKQKNDKHIFSISDHWD